MTDYSRDIEKYLKGELSAAERNALERKALHDPFLADALEGAEQIAPSDFLQDVTDLNQKIANQKKARTWMWPARIAAGVAIISVSAFLIWSLTNTPQQNELALEKSEPGPSTPITSDSITTLADEMPATTEQPAAGPSGEEQAAASRTVSPSKAQTKPQQSPPISSTAPVKKNEPPTVAPLVADTKTEDIKADEVVTESVVQAKEAEKAEVAPARAEDDQKQSKLADRDLAKRKKSMAADKDIAGASAGFVNASQVVTGKITSAENGDPLPGVNVMIKGSTIGTVSDAKGDYQIAIDNSNTTLVYSFIGLESTEVAAKDRNQIDVNLREDNSQQSEIVIRGMVGPKPLSVSVDMAHPESGDRAFKQYLEKNLRYPEAAKTNKIEGRVTVEFTVDVDGTVTDFTILKGIGHGCDEELIRLIKEGPKWVPTKYNSNPVQDKAKVRLKFELPD